MRVLLVGLGDFGRSVTKILLSKGVEVTAIDTQEVAIDGVDFIRKNALSEELWNEIDLEKYSSAVIAVPNDIDALLLIMMLRNKKKDMLIIARCNDPAYREKMFMAGADYVVDISTITSQMIISTIFREDAEKKLIYENIHVRTYFIDENSPISGSEIGNFDGVHVLAIEKDGKTRDYGKIEPNSKIAVIGKIEDLKKFEGRFINPSKQ